jgi:putative peptidoglycan lipid II flippase
MPTVNRRILAAAITVGTMNGIVMIVAVLRDLVFAYRFGTGAIVDAFLMGLLVPTMAVQIIGGSLGLAIVPEVIRLHGSSDRAEADLLSSSTTLIGLALLLSLSVILLLLHHSLIAVLTVGFDAERTRLTSFFLLGLLPCIVVQGWSAFLGGLLNATHRFAIVALAPMLRPFALCLVLAVDWGSASADVLLGGYLAGAIAEAGLVTVAAARAKLLFRPRWGGLTEPLRRVMREFALVVMGSGILSAAMLADQYFASVAVPGGVSAYGYGSKITSVLIGVGALPLGVAILPHFSVQVREGQWTQLRSVLVHWSWIVLALSVPAAALLWFYSGDLVKLIFQRGAFSPEDSRLVAAIQMYLALQLPFYLCGILYVRVLISLQRNGLVALVALVNAVTNIGGSLLLLGPLGAVGIALAASCGYMVATILSGLFAFLLLRRDPAMVSAEAAALPDAGLPLEILNDGQLPLR